MQKYKVQFTARFTKSLLMIYDYIFFELENPISAERTEVGIKRKCANLSIFPKRSSIRKRVRGKGLRFVHFRNYTIVYYVDEDGKTVRIYDVFYSRRDVDKLLND